MNNGCICIPLNLHYMQAYYIITLPGSLWMKWLCIWVLQHLFDATWHLQTFYLSKSSRKLNMKQSLTGSSWSITISIEEKVNSNGPNIKPWGTPVANSHLKQNVHWRCGRDDHKVTLSRIVTAIISTFLM